MKYSNIHCVANMLSGLCEYHVSTLSLKIFLFATLLSVYDLFVQYCYYLFVVKFDV